MSSNWFRSVHVISEENGLSIDVAADWKIDVETIDIKTNIIIAYILAPIRGYLFISFLPDTILITLFPFKNVFLENEEID
jgi:hypothetical protein